MSETDFSINFGSDVGGDTIADILRPVEGWIVTLGLNGGEQEGKVVSVSKNGITLEEEGGRENLFYWISIQFVTIH